MLCKIDSKKFDKLIGLSMHVRQAHKMSLLEYFTKYENFKAPKCKNCEKDAKYKKIGLSFFEFCSQSCNISYHTKKFKQKRVKFKKGKIIENFNKSAIKGSFAEYKVIADLLRQGYVPCKPCTEGQPFDLICVKNDKILKIQVKSDFNLKEKNTIAIMARSSNGSYGLKHVDVLAIYSIKSDKCYYIELKKILNKNKSSIALRLCKTKNNQAKNITFAEDYENL
jgi:PD-(D/E)XK endonuclease